MVEIIKLLICIEIGFTISKGFNYYVLITKLISDVSMFYLLRTYVGSLYVGSFVYNLFWWI